MKKKFLRIPYTLFLIAFMKTSLLFAMEGNPREELCILCTASKPSLCQFTALRAHLRNAHQCSSRLLYLCNMCNYSGLGHDIKTHFRIKHHSKLSSLKILECMRIPFMTVNSRIHPKKMREYSMRLYALLDEHQMADSSHSINHILSLTS